MSRLGRSTDFGPKILRAMRESYCLDDENDRVHLASDLVSAKIGFVAAQREEIYQVLTRKCSSRCTDNNADRAAIVNELIKHF